HDTWSGITLNWPVDPSGETAPVELSGLPIFDRDRSFLGYRGFGVCRDLAFTTPRPPQSSTPHLVHDAPSPEPTRQQTDGVTESTAESAPEPRPLLTVVPAVK